MAAAILARHPARLRCCFPDSRRQHGQEEDDEADQHTGSGSSARSVCVMVRMRRNQAYQQRAALDKIINTIQLAHMAAYAMEQVPNEDLMGQGLEGAIAVLRDALGEARRAYWDGALSDLTFTLRHAAEGEQDEPNRPWRTNG